MTRSKIAGVLCLAVAVGLLATGCASDRDDTPEYHVGRPRPEGRDRAVRAAPVVSPQVFLFLSYDGDHDHRFTRAELAAAIAGSWQQLAKGAPDVSVMTLRDWFGQVYGAADVAFGPLEFDPMGTGRVTREAFAQVLTHRFEALDRNHDGVLEAAEFMTVPRGRHGTDERGPERYRRDEDPTRGGGLPDPQMR